MLASHVKTEEEDLRSKSNNPYIAMFTSQFNMSLTLLPFLNTSYHLYKLFLRIRVATHQIKTWWFSIALLYKFWQKKETTVLVNYSSPVFCPYLFTASEEKQVSQLPEFEHWCNISSIHIINMYYTTNKMYIPENQSTNTHS